ncbi:MAG: DoxX family protein [Cytophagales bacterium]|nr:DoxX family protein [Cytophagales bacterium]
MSQKNSTLNIALWITQGILAVMFSMAGFMKLSTPIDILVSSVPWAKDVSETLVRFIGATELLAGIGFLLPSIFRILPKLTPLAAFGVFLIMVLAAGFHISRMEYNELIFNLFIGSMAIFVVWGRLFSTPIPSKTN